jgi:hypothetical protein
MRTTNAQVIAATNKAQAISLLLTKRVSFSWSLIGIGWGISVATLWKETPIPGLEISPLKNELHHTKTVESLSCHFL